MGVSVTDSMSEGAASVGVISTGRATDSVAIAVAMAALVASIAAAVAVASALSVGGVSIGDNVGGGVSAGAASVGVIATGRATDSVAMAVAVAAAVASSSSRCCCSFDSCCGRGIRWRLCYGRRLSWRCIRRRDCDWPTQPDSVAIARSSYAVAVASSGVAVAWHQLLQLAQHSVGATVMDGVSAVAASVGVIATGRATDSVAIAVVEAVAVASSIVAVAVASALSVGAVSVGDNVGDGVSAGAASVGVIATGRATDSVAIAVGRSCSGRIIDSRCRGRFGSIGGAATPWAQRSWTASLAGTASVGVIATGRATDSVATTVVVAVASHRHWSRCCGGFGSIGGRNCPLATM